MIGRRKIVLGLGGALVLGSAGVWRVTRLPETASEPWGTLHKPEPDIRLDAFRHAILAPNPHNRQPWLIRLEAADSVMLSCDLAKRLPETDPFDRQITIGFGAFIELARIAASHRGVRLEVENFPEGDPQPRLDTRPLARLRFIAEASVIPDPLRAAIALRRTNRQVYSAAPDAAQRAMLGQGGVQVSSDAALLIPARAIAVAAITREMNTHRTHMESVNLMRIGSHEIDAQPDGLALSGPLIEATGLLGLTTRETLADPASTSFRLGLEDLQRVYGSVPALAWITTPGNTRADQLAAGAAYARLTLRAAALGLALHPLSQSLQEYPEMAEHFAAIHTLLGANGPQRVQMMARMGKAPTVPPAARYPLEAHLRA